MDFDLEPAFGGTRLRLVDRALWGARISAEVGLSACVRHRVQPPTSQIPSGDRGRTRRVGRARDTPRTTGVSHFRPLLVPAATLQFRPHMQQRHNPKATAVLRHRRQILRADLPSCGHAVRVVLRPIPHNRWPIRFRPDPAFWGPNRDDDCPCGSRRRARSCHSAKDGTWLSPPLGPLLTGPRTGYSHVRCYAAVSNDCSPRVSSEHWLSDNILRAADGGKPVLMSGMPWQAGDTHRLSAKAMGANVLCDRHNGALSRLDSVTGQLFRTLRDFQADLREVEDPHGHEFALFHGDVIERWMLKLFWGATAARTLGKVGQRIEGLRADIDLAWLADVLFRGEPLPDKWGLYMAGRIGIPFSGEAEVAIQPTTGPDGSLWAGTVEFGAVALQFCLGVPQPSETINLQWHPLGLFLLPARAETQKVVALPWDAGGSKPFVLTRLANGTVDRLPSDL